jgi:hypothetical protein
MIAPPPRGGGRLSKTVAAAAVLGLVTGSVGCGRERMCRDGEYPAVSTEFPESGRVCVPGGQAPPTGYTTYPPGQTPTYLDQDR